jgi:predicted RND superfamily exporter protein
MRLAGISFNLANIIVLPLLIGLGVAFGIYLVTRWRSGIPVADLLQTSTPEAVLFSALTTMSSFGSLAVASDPGMSVLGRTLSISLAAVLLCILILLPALLALRATPTPGARAGRRGKR